VRSDPDRVRDILETIERIERHAAGGRAAFDNDELRNDRFEVVTRCQLSALYTATRSPKLFGRRVRLKTVLITLSQFRCASPAIWPAGGSFGSRTTRGR
jgi:hypothetical protein